MDGERVLLLTRPRDRSERFAAEIRARADHAVRTVISPLAEIRCTAPAELSGAGAVILTSPAAAACLPPGAGAGRVAYCVGARTAEAARIAGFAPVSADGDARALVDLILRAAPAGRLLHLRGAQVAADVAGALRRAGLDAAERVVYAQVDVAPTAAALDVLAGTAGIVAPVFSPLGARRLAALAADARAPLHVIAISTAAAAPFAGSRARVDVAAAPDGAAMRDSVVAALDQGAAC